MTLFVDDVLLHDAGWFTVWRRSRAEFDVVGVRIVGHLTDEKNPIWRAWLDDEFSRTRWPRFIALDVKGALPAASLPKRLQTAMWGKKVLGLIEHGSIHLGTEASVSLTVRATLRIAGMTNASMRNADVAFAADVDAMMAGRAPVA